VNLSLLPGHRSCRTAANTSPKRPDRIFYDKYTSGFLHRYRQNPHYFGCPEPLEVGSRPALVFSADSLAGREHVRAAPGPEPQGLQMALPVPGSQSNAHSLLIERRPRRIVEIARM